MGLSSDCLGCRAILGLRRLIEDTPTLDHFASDLLTTLLIDVIVKELQDGCTEADYATYLVEQATARLGTHPGE